MITALPPEPLPTDSPVIFNTKSFNLVAALSTFVTDANTLQVDVNNKATIATTQAALATTNGATQVALAEEQVSLAAEQVALAEEQVSLAAEQVTLAAASATAAAGSALVAGAVAWVSGTTYAAGDTRYSPINLQTYRRISAGAGTTDPSIDATNWALALNAGISNVVTATGMTTLTNTPTLLQITPVSYGVTVTLPDATACKLGGPLHIIDNRGAYPVRVCNASGVLKGFIFAGVVSHVSLSDNSTTAGVWAIENNELVGASAQLLTTAFAQINACVSIDASREYIQGYSVSNSNLYGAVYDRSTNTFGTPTLIRTGSIQAINTAVLSAANQILAVSCVVGAATFEAVTLSISATTITVNTAATATLSANISGGGFADGCGLIAVGSSFVTSYRLATPTAQIRALSVSGTTVTIGAATVLDGTTGGLIAAAANHVIAVSTAGASLYTKPYLVAASTLSAGTGTTTTGTSASLNKVASLGARWLTLHSVDGGNNLAAGVVSLSTSGNGTTTISNVTCMAQQLADAIVVSANKVLILGTNTADNANIVTDTAGTASAGTAITLSSQTARACAYVSGTDVFVVDGTTSNFVHKVDCSGASPVKTLSFAGQLGDAPMPVSNAVLTRGVTALYGTDYARTTIMSAANTVWYGLQIRKGVASRVLQPDTALSQGVTQRTNYRGKADSERWGCDGSTVITKLECVL